LAKRWIHPWWLHLPAWSMWLGFLVYVSTRIGVWPDRVPLRYGFEGIPTAWGSPWIPFELVVGLGLLFLVLSAVLDELWARQETRKAFNPLTLLDELVVGLLVATHAALVEAAIRGTVAVSFPWVAVLSVVGSGVGIAVVLERLRPFAASPIPTNNLRADGLHSEVAARIGQGERIVYWDVQNPRYVKALSLGIPAVLWVGAGMAFASELWPAGLLVLVGVLLLQFYGGQRTRVTRDEVTIRYGLVGIRVLRCRTQDIEAIRLRTFAALREFGGYGIRFARSTVGFFLAGSQGVLLVRPGRRAVLIGSDHPARLAAVISAVTGIELEASTTKEEDG